VVSISDPIGTLRSCVPSVNEDSPGGVTITAPDTRPMSSERPKLGGGSPFGWAIALEAARVADSTTAPAIHLMMRPDLIGSGS
jgi:hypothetical protein